ncbi:MAG: hypothetical protein ABEJ22_02820 [Haloferacaceae archaeon]
MPSRRAFLGVAGAGLASLAGCTSLPAGPTEGITYARTKQVEIPSVPRPAEPTDAHVLARRSHLDGLVTAAEPLFERAGEADLGESNYRDCAIGVESVRDFLEESADDPASMDVGFAKSRVRYAGDALGFLRSWYGLATPETAFERVRAARRELADATASMPRDCADPATYLARIGWAERMLSLAYVGIDQYGDAPPEFGTGEDATRERTASAVGRLYRQAAKATGFVLDGRYVARAYAAGRPAETTDFAGALERNRTELLRRATERAPEPETSDERADDYDDPVVNAYVRRAGNPAGHGRESLSRAERRAGDGRLALAAIDAARANCYLAGYERVFDELDPETLRGGVAAGDLFAEKRATVRSVREALHGEDPLHAWLASEPARLLYSGEVYLDDADVNSAAVGRAVCLNFFRHARGYAEELASVVETLERRE